MIRKRQAWLVSGVAAVLGCAIAGCNRSEQADHTPPPGQEPAVPAPVSVPAPATQPISPKAYLPSFLYIKEVPDPRKSQTTEVAPADPAVWGPTVQFARARLSIVGKGGHALSAVLFSDDPKEALKDNWTGDRYLFRMPLRINDRKAIDGYRYRWTNSLEGADETDSGIFLRGDSEHIEPVDLDVQFVVDGSTVKVWLGGLFKQFDPGTGETHWYHVRGIIHTSME